MITINLGMAVFVLSIVSIAFACLGAYFLHYGLMDTNYRFIIIGSVLVCPIVAMFGWSSKLIGLSWQIIAIELVSIVLISLVATVIYKLVFLRG